MIFFRFDYFKNCTTGSVILKKYPFSKIMDQNPNKMFLILNWKFQDDLFLRNENEELKGD
jgi:hypothetical protein